MHGRHQLADSLADSDITVAPGIYDGISARLVERQGFETGFLSGAAISNSRLAQPDVGFLGLSEVADQTRQITAAVDIPVWVDADTGYGNAVNVHRTVRTLADAGTALVMIEDQDWPKRCGHMAGKSVVPFDEAVTKIEAAADARDEHAPDLLIKARTDATETHGLEEAVRRLNAFADAGADVVFADALLSEDGIRRVAADVDDAHLSINMGFGVRSRPTTPLIPAKRLEEMGVDASSTRGSSPPRRLREWSARSMNWRRPWGRARRTSRPTPSSAGRSTRTSSASPRSTTSTRGTRLTRSDRAFDGQDALPCGDGRERADIETLASTPYLHGRGSNGGI